MLYSIENIREIKVGEIVSSDIRTADVFKKYGIDFCCRGDLMLGEVCEDQGVDLDALYVSLEDVLSGSKGPVHDYQNWSVPFLIDYINNTHHPYVRSVLPVLIQYGEKVCNAHGDKHQETFDVLRIIKELNKELLGHLLEEEEEDFPVLRAFMSLENGEHSELIQKALKKVHDLRKDHVKVGDLVLELEHITNNFTPPPDGCNTYMVYYKKLEEFRDDLFNHIHLENNILFEKVMKHKERIIN